MKKAIMLLSGLVLVASITTAAPDVRSAPMTFGGWISQWHPDWEVMKASPKLFDSISFCWFNIEKDDGLTRTAPADRDAIVAWARNNGIKTFMTIGGGQDAITGKAGEKAIAGMVAECEKQGFDGVDVDVEGLDRSARDAYTIFAAKLLNALKSMKPPRLLSLTIQPVVSAEEEAGSFFDYMAIGRLADIVRVMHYDISWDEAGPIMSRERFAEELAYAASRIPLSKYVPALPWYGRDWNLTAKTHMDILWRMTEDKDGICGADELVSKYGGKPRWSEAEGELTFTYTREGAKHEVWMADPRQFAWMIDEAKKAGVAGVYAWQIEYADPGFMSVVREKLAKKGRKGAPRDRLDPPFL